MSKPNIPLESTPKVITRSQAKQDSQLAKIVDLKQKGSLKIKPVRSREYLADNKYKNIPDPIPTEQELDNTIKLGDLSLDKTLINNQSISSENSEKNSEFHSSFCPDLSNLPGSSNQYQTLTNELFHFDESKLLSSTVVTIDNKTLKEKLNTSLTSDSIISNDSDHSGSTHIGEKGNELKHGSISPGTDT